MKKSRWKSIQVEYICPDDCNRTISQFQAVFGRFSLSWFSPFSALPKHTKQHGYLFSVWGRNMGAPILCEAKLLVVYSFHHIILLWSWDFDCQLSFADVDDWNYHHSTEWHQGPNRQGLSTQHIFFDYCHSILDKSTPIIGNLDTQDKVQNLFMRPIAYIKAISTFCWDYHKFDNFINKHQLWWTKAVSSIISKSRENFLLELGLKSGIG